MTVIYRELVPEGRRVEHTAALFGLNFPLRLEPSIFTLAERLSPDYHGGYWHFYALSNGGFYMAPEGEAPSASAARTASRARCRPMPSAWRCACTPTAT